MQRAQYSNSAFVYVSADVKIKSIKCDWSQLFQESQVYWVKEIHKCINLQLAYMEGRLDVLFLLHLIEVKGVIASNHAPDISVCVAMLQPGFVCLFFKSYQVYKVTQVILWH